MNQILIFLIICYSIEASDLSLPQAQSILLENNKQLAAARHSIDKQKLLIRQYKALYQPSVTGSASYSYLTEKNHMSFETEITNPITGLPVPIAIDRDLGDNDKVELGIDITYPVFTGLSRFHSVQQAEHGLRAEKARYDALKNQLLFTLGIQFTTWELAFKKTALQQKLVQQIAEHTQRIEKLLAGGVVVASDLLNARAAYAKGQCGLIATKNSADSLRYEIGVLCGLSNTVITPLEYNPESLLLSDDKRASLTMKKDRAELIMLHENIQQLVTAGKGLFGLRLPSLGATVGLRYGDPGLNMGGEGFMGYGIAGMRLSWTIYDGMVNRYQRQALLHQQKMLEEQAQDMMNAWQARISQAQLAYENSKQLQQAAELSRTASRQYAQEMKYGLDAGTKTSLEYLQAITDEAEAGFDYEKARAANAIATLNLLFAAGCTIEYFQ